MPSTDLAKSCKVEPRALVHEEAVPIPKVARDVVYAALTEAVEQGRLRLTSGQASILAEPIPAGILAEDAQLQAPPQPIPASDVAPSAIPDVWTSQSTTALAIAVALLSTPEQKYISGPE